MAKPFGLLRSRMDPTRRARVERRVREEIARIGGASSRGNGGSPETRAAAAGLYELVGPRGGRTGVETTVGKGERLPPPRRPGQHWVLVEASKVRIPRSLKSQ